MISKGKKPSAAIVTQAKFVGVILCILQSFNDYMAKVNKTLSKKE